MLKPLSPFFPGSFHTGAGRQFAIGFEGANVVAEVFAKDKGNAEAATADLAAALTKHATIADKVGNKVATETGWAYVGVDPTPAPLGEVSIGAAIEGFTGAKFGSAERSRLRGSSPPQSKPYDLLSRSFLSWLTVFVNESLIDTRVKWRHRLFVSFQRTCAGCVRIAPDGLLVETFR